MAVFEVAGRGRKQCSCGKYVGVKCRVCEACGAKLTDAPAPAPKPQAPKIVHDAPGPGLKLCEACHKYVGARTQKCPNCGADMPAKNGNGKADLGVPDPQKTHLDSPKEIEDTAPKCACPKVPGHWPVQDRIEAEGSISARLCGCKHRLVLFAGIMTNEKPIPKLEGTSTEQIDSWASKVMEWGHNRQIHLAPAALRHFARTFFDLTTPEYAVVAEALRNYGCSQPLEDYEEETDDGTDLGGEDCPEHMDVVDEDGNCAACGKK